MMRWIVVVVALAWVTASVVYLNQQLFTTDGPEIQEYAQVDKVTATLKDPMADSDGDGLLNWGRGSLWE